MTIGTLSSKVKKDFPHLPSRELTRWIHFVFQWIVAGLASGRSVDLALFGKFYLNKGRIQFSPNKAFLDACKYNLVAPNDERAFYANKLRTSSRDIFFQVRPDVRARLFTLPLGRELPSTRNLPEDLTSSLLAKLR